MRRLLLILLAFMAFVPAMPAQASHRHAPSCAACPMQGDHDGNCADHGCLGCSIEADPVATVAPRLGLPAAILVADEIAVPTHHRPGFDPPPPRADG